MLREPECGTASAYLRTYSELTGKEPDIRPNDLLAIAYFRAAMRAVSLGKLTVHAEWRRLFR